VEDLPEQIQSYVARTPIRHIEGDEVFAKAMPLHVALEVPERKIIEAALQRNAWNRQATADELDINRTTLYKKMRKYQLDVGETN
jgi:DNA-binding NtrC family response regulator